MKKNTKIILQKDVKNLGVQGVIAAVTRGYAVNYLIPNNIAILAKPGIIKHINMLTKLKEEKAIKNLSKANGIKNRIEQIQKIVLYRTAGKDQLIFGQITDKDVLKILNKQANINLSKNQITIPNIKQIGLYEITIVILQTVNLNLKLQIMPKDI